MASYKYNPKKRTARIHFRYNRQHLTKVEKVEDERHARRIVAIIEEMPAWGGKKMLTYLDKRAPENRLDSVCGPDGWYAEYEATNRGYKCRLFIKGPITRNWESVMALPPSAIDIGQFLLLPGPPSVVRSKFE